MHSDELIDSTIKFWSPRYGCAITREEARPMTPSWNGMYSFLLETGWLRQEIPLRA